ARLVTVLRRDCHYVTIALTRCELECQERSTGIHGYAGESASPRHDLNPLQGLRTARYSYLSLEGRRTLALPVRRHEFGPATFFSATSPCTGDTAAAPVAPFATFASARARSLPF